MRTQAPIKRTGFPAVIILFLLLAASFSLAFASVLSVVRGYVKEKTTGTPMAEVKLTLVLLMNTSARFELQTDKDGYFVKTGLQQGMYRLTADKEGYLPAQTIIRLKAADVYEADLRLEALESKLSETSSGLISASNRLMRAGKYDEAIEKMTQAIETEPGNFILYYYRATIHERKSDNYKALVDFKKSLELKPDFLLPLSALGNIYAKREEFSEAVHYFKKALDLGLTDTFALYNYGACLIHQGRVPEAKAVFEEVVRLDPGYAEAYYQLGMIHLGLNNNARAKKFLGNFIRLAPGNSNAAVVREILQTLK